MILHQIGAAPHPELILYFFCIAAVYASAGFGGGSSYLAVLALYGFPAGVMRPLALLCNILVTGGSVWIFWKNGLLLPRKTWPMLAASVPLAFLGAYLPMKERTFLLLLGGSLVAAALLLFFQKKLAPKNPGGFQGQNLDVSDDPNILTKNRQTLGTAALGGGIGFLSGMVGIGGGIFLSPVLNLLRWAPPKQVAATAALFILVNSLAGIGGQLAQNQHIDWTVAFPLAGAVLAGGQLGSRLSALNFGQKTVRTATAGLTLYAGLNLLFQHL